MNRTLLLFLLFVASNSFLSYTPLPPAAKGTIFLLGIALPWAWARAWVGPTRKIDEGILPPTGLWAWALLALASIGARFFHLTTLLVWPNFDESSYGFDALHLASGWPPRFFYGVSQAPPLFVWGMAAFFKVFGVSLSSFWAFPALLSLLAVPLAYVAARSVLSRSFSLLAAGLVAIGFWPVFLGRFALMTILVLPFECLALGALGWFLRTSDPRSRSWSAAVLGTVWGLGFYVHLHWPIVVAVTFIPFASRLWDRRKDANFAPTRIFALAFLAAGIVVLPLFLAAWREHYGGYLAHLWVFHEGFSWSKQSAVWLSCLTSPFWGMDPDVHTYQPVWGGFLNPVLSSLFFLGTLSWFRKDTPPLERWTSWALGLCLLPGLLTRDQETFRLFPMVPFLILGILTGWGKLTRDWAPSKNLVFLVGIAMLSGALDAGHLFGAFHRTWDDPRTWGSYTKSFGRYRAYQVLEERRKAEGPGLIFPDFVQGLPDQSLKVATFGYNTALNPSLSSIQARWAAVLTNVNYEPFLRGRFPGGKAYAVTKEIASSDGGWMLFVFPTAQAGPGTLERWVHAQQALEPFLDRDLCYVMGSSFEGDIDAFSALGPYFQDDPFLRTAFLEKKADLWTKQTLAGYGPSREAKTALSEAVREGYPAAHLYEKLGVFHLLQGDRTKARDCFRRATHASLDLTDSAAHLRALELEATGAKDRAKNE